LRPVIGDRWKNISRKTAEAVQGEKMKPTIGDCLFGVKIFLFETDAAMDDPALGGEPSIPPRRPPSGQPAAPAAWQLLRIDLRSTFP
jgi:hypothetical protein